MKRAANHTALRDELFKDNLSRIIFNVEFEGVEDKRERGERERERGRWLVREKERPVNYFIKI